MNQMGARYQNFPLSLQEKMLEAFKQERLRSGLPAAPAAVAVEPKEEEKEEEKQASTTSEEDSQQIQRLQQLILEPTHSATASYSGGLVDNEKIVSEDPSSEPATVDSAAALTNTPLTKKRYDVPPDVLFPKEIIPSLNLSFGFGFPDEVNTHLYQYILEASKDSLLTILNSFFPNGTIAIGPVVQVKNHIQWERLPEELRSNLFEKFSALSSTKDHFKFVIFLKAFTSMGLQFADLPVDLQEKVLEHVSHSSEMIETPLDFFEMLQV
jgi:hypothetical protein